MAQQTPSTQRVLVHWGPVVQAAPCGRRLVHDPDWQLNPAAQSALIAAVFVSTLPIAAIAILHLSTRLRGFRHNVVDQSRDGR